MRCAQFSKRRSSIVCKGQTETDPLRRVLLRWACVAWMLFLVAGRPAVVVAADHVGRVLVGRVPLPGATVTAVHGNSQRTTVTDEQGIYHFEDLAEGIWTFRVEMLGFATLTQDVAVGKSALTWELKLLPFREITRGLPGQSEPQTTPPAAAAARPAVANEPTQAGARVPTGAESSEVFQRAQVNIAAAGARVIDDPSVDADRAQSVGEGFLINGSVNNGAASPFAQLASFGNNRRSGRSLYNGGLAVLLGNSAWDAQPFSFTKQQTPNPSYRDMQILGSFAGPLKIPRLLKNGPTMFVGYQRTVDHNASTQSTLMPTALEHSGNFSQTLDRFGRPRQIVRPPALRSPETLSHRRG